MSVYPKETPMSLVLAALESRDLSTNFIRVTRWYLRNGSSNPSRNRLPRYLGDNPVSYERTFKLIPTLPDSASVFLNMQSIRGSECIVVLEGYEMALAAYSFAASVNSVSKIVCSPFKAAFGISRLGAGSWPPRNSRVILLSW